jgi:uncharacterized protein YjbI with pentapeptide repeats
MANPKHLKTLNQGVEVWNKWRKKNPDVRPDLIQANFRRSDLRKADFREADLRKAEISMKQSVCP